MEAPGKVMLRRFVRNSKHDPLVDEVDLLEVNPTYAMIRHLDGRESSVSLRDLSPHHNSVVVDPDDQFEHILSTPETTSDPEVSGTESVLPNVGNTATNENVPDETKSITTTPDIERKPEHSILRRSTRQKFPVDRYMAKW